MVICEFINGRTAVEMLLILLVIFAGMGIRFVMTLTAVVLIVISAFMHAGWNFVSKRRSPSLAFFFLTAVAAALVMSPLLVMQRRTLPFIPGSVWFLILATGVAQAVYFWGLSGAYKRGDISLAYPLARALPVLFIAALSLLLGQGRAIGNSGLAGMALITLGCIILPFPAFRTMRPRDYLDLVMLMALVAAIGTTAYTLIDDQALRQLRSTAEINLSNGEVTLLFISLQMISTALMLGLATILIRSERRQMGEFLGNRSLILTGLITGVVIMATYGLVLASMAYVSNVSYVAAFRQLSIPIGAVLGLTLQREPRYRPKLIGIVVVTIGLLFVAVG